MGGENIFLPLFFTRYSAYKVEQPAGKCRIKVRSGHNYISHVGSKPYAMVDNYAAGHR
jgi:hypothetical protein